MSGDADYFTTSEGGSPEQHLEVHHMFPVLEQRSSSSPSTRRSPSQEAPRQEAPRRSAPSGFEQSKKNWNGSKRQSQLMLELSILKKQAQAGPDIDLYRRKCRALNSRVKQLEHDTAKRKVVNTMSRKQTWLNPSPLSQSGNVTSKLSLAYEELLKRDQLIETMKEQHEHLKKEHENSVSAFQSVQRRNVEAVTTSALLKQKNTTLTQKSEELRAHVSRIHAEKKAMGRHNEKLKQAIFNLENGITIENYKEENEMMIGTVNHMSKQIDDLTSKLEKANQQILAQDLEIHRAFAKQAHEPLKAREHLKSLVLNGHLHRAIGTSFHNHPATRTIAQQALKKFVDAVDNAKLDPTDTEHNQLIHTSNVVRMIQKMGNKMGRKMGHKFHENETEIEEDEGSFNDEDFAHHTLEHLTPLIGCDMKKNKGGTIEVASLEQDKSAEYSGLEVGDIILQAKDKAVSSPEEIDAMVKEMEVGTRLELTVQRNDEEIKISLLIGAEETTVEEIENLLKDEVHHEKSKDETPSAPVYDVFLGGSCNPTTWRSEIGVPTFKSAGVSYYNPQRDDWSPALVALEAHVKKNCMILLFVIDKKTRSIASMLEATEYISNGRQVVLAIQDVEEGTEMYGVECSEGELKDLNRARKYLLDVALRHGVPYFQTESCIPDAIASVTQKIKVMNFSSYEVNPSRAPSRSQSRATSRLNRASKGMKTKSRAASRSGSRAASRDLAQEQLSDLASKNGGHLLVPGMNIPSIDFD